MQVMSSSSACVLPLLLDVVMSAMVLACDNGRGLKQGPVSAGSSKISQQRQQRQQRQQYSSAVFMYEHVDHHSTKYAKLDRRQKNYHDGAEMVNARCLCLIVGVRSFASQPLLSVGAIPACRGDPVPWAK